MIWERPAPESDDDRRVDHFTRRETARQRRRRIARKAIDPATLATLVRLFRRRQLTKGRTK